MFLSSPWLPRVPLRERRIWCVWAFSWSVVWLFLQSISPIALLKAPIPSWVIAPILPLLFLIVSWISYERWTDKDPPSCPSPAVVLFFVLAAYFTLPWSIDLAIRWTTFNPNPSFIDALSGYILILAYANTSRLWAWPDWAAVADWWSTDGDTPPPSSSGSTTEGEDSEDLGVSS